MNEIDKIRSSDLRRKDAARLRLLDTLRRQGPQSRAALGRLLALSPASISGLTATLIAENLLVDAGIEPSDTASGPGRPGILVGFNPALGHVIGLWVGLDRIALHLSDFAGRMIAAREENVGISHLPVDELVAVLAARVALFRQDFAENLRVMALGIAFQGFVDRAEGRVVWSPVTRNVDIPLRQRMEQETGLPVEIDNDASAMAYAITCADRDLQHGVTACVMLGDGVGLGVFIDGEPLRGSHGGGIEFGHIPLNPDGPQCRCGARGCVESYLADYAQYRDAHAFSGTAPLLARQPGEADMAAIIARADSGERAVVALLENAGRMLSQGVTTLIHLFQPRAVVFCGPGVRAWHHIERGLSDGLRRHTIPGLAREIAISARPFGPELLTQGVILNALGRIDRMLAAT